MPLPDAAVVDDAYASSEDSDFAPDNVPDNASAADSDDGDNDDNDDKETADAAGATTERKHGPGAGDGAEAEDAGFENSGDEAIIGKGKKRRRRDKEAAAADVRSDDDADGDGGGVGGFVKTRHQRANE